MIFDHPGGEIPHSNPLLSKHRYIESKGLKREWSQTQSKELVGDAPCKKMQALQEAKAFMECLGPVGRGGLNLIYPYIAYMYRAACSEYL